MKITTQLLIIGTILPTTEAFTQLHRPCHHNNDLSSAALLLHSSKGTSTSLNDGKSSTDFNSKSSFSDTITFSAPLLDEGYPPAVNEYKHQTHIEKPLLLYLPGFDGTILAPFLQYPELQTEFDVRGMSISMKDRSSVDVLRDSVLEFLRNNVESEGRPIYLMGESFGGILTLEVTLAIQRENIQNNNQQSNINLQGIVLINPATSYLRSKLALQGPPLTQIATPLYPIALTRILPLFTDDYALPQLLLMLQSEALPSIIDTAQREAYMGRMAFSLGSKLKFMPQATLKWRLEEWLEKGCAKVLKAQEQQEEDDNEEGNGLTFQQCVQNLPVLMVVGEKDETLPSVEEAQRAQDIYPNLMVHTVLGSGHACTSGSRVDLTALMRDCFSDQLMQKADDDDDDDNQQRRKAMKETAMNRGTGKYFGMEPRYDNANIGLSPLVYWSDENYQQL